MSVFSTIWGWFKIAFTMRTDFDDDFEERAQAETQNFGMGRFVGDTTSLSHDSSFVDDF